MCTPESCTKLQVYLCYSASYLKPLVLLTVSLLAGVLIPRETPFIGVQLHYSLLQWLNIWNQGLQTERKTNRRNT